MRSEALEKALAPYAAFEDGKRLRAGFTTGSAAAAAASAAATLLFSGERCEAVLLRTPVGALLPIPIECAELRDENGVRTALAAVRKDAGDDPDVTDGLLFYASVRTERSRGTGNSERSESTAAQAGTEKVSAADASALPVVLCGGPGVGRVTKPGLEQPVGEAAINRVPRNMIAEAVRAAYRESASAPLAPEERVVVTLSCPEGEEKAQKTFNPKLGIEGGLSILGTEGIVRPMSRRALIETIVTDVKFHLTERDCLLAVPGSYGLHFLEDHFGLGAADPVVMSNFVGETLDAAVQYGAKGVLLAGHLGKFVKLAGGIMNTHSREADCRLELLAIHAFQVGAPRELVTAVLKAGLTTEAVRLLKEAGYLKATSESLLSAMERAAESRVRGETEIGILVYTLEDGVLAESRNARDLMRRSIGGGEK
ncbi:cobalt-precorrin-5B (C(1))-methyltransferase CbiD [Stomatobaculum sp. F0698]|uniref:cobalt-precorrin-5B (C(1))-methyltransferase CbiD n=1 Tax=Stomatobaculum sp. F0698 TaxID=3059030 RepID=UPI00272C95A5|nr:cobalt-precorrin-5B (C(1))-methyltransferase CbiD [Stomatobaculum sp. F0698]WLD87357.1 cobalt-precorrin-5B (C(1))-methyltransferase CbiD [Stomatobaculum sp. F0698]